jgi:hypothetical protein
MVKPCHEKGRVSSRLSLRRDDVCFPAEGQIPEFTVRDGFDQLGVHQRKEAIQRLAEGAVQADLARSYGVSQATISRLAAPSPFEPRLAGVL